MTEKIIPFTEEADSIVSSIIEEYNLKESQEEVVKRLKENKLFNENIIVKATRDFMNEIFSNKESISGLQKDLGISQETAERIFNDIKIKLIPILQKTPENKKEILTSNKEGINVLPKIKPAVSTAELTEKNSAEKIIVPAKKNERAKKPTIIAQNNKESIQKKKQPRRPDTYREPIE